MQLTKSQEKLIQDAKSAGYTVEISGACVDVFKVSRSGGSVSKGIRVYEDGTAHRLDVELGSANTIRTQKMMRKILGV